MLIFLCLTFHTRFFIRILCNIDEQLRNMSSLEETTDTDGHIEYILIPSVQNKL